MDHMPRFAANLAYLFTERPLLERFGAAAAAGFKAVELQAPYDHTPAALKAEIDKHGLTQLGINTFVGGRPGDSGLGAVPGRERDWDVVFKQALDYTVAIGGSAIHCMAGKVPTGAAAGGGADLHRQSDARRRSGAGQERHAADRADQPARPAELFSHPRRAGRRHHRQGRQAQRENPVRFLSCADRRAAISSPASRSTCR